MTTTKKMGTILIIILGLLMQSCSMSKTYLGSHNLSEGINHGIMVGTIQEVDYSHNEITVVSHYGIMNIGSIVLVINKGNGIILVVSTSTQTTFKCILMDKQNQSIKDIKKGFSVFMRG